MKCDAARSDHEAAAVPYAAPRLVTDERSNAGGEVRTWFEELRRLVAEAETRFEVGSVLPALSSLVAVPPLHRMLVERCTELLAADEGEEQMAEASCGLYL